MSTTPDLCTCLSCGYQWPRGLNGEHSCTESLRQIIAQMLPAVRWRCDALSVEDQAELPQLIRTAEMVAWRYLTPEGAVK